MASIRRLKKDIDCLTFAVVDDCLNCLCCGKSADELSGIVQSVIDNRNSLRQRVNAGRSLPKGERKAHYRAICKETVDSVDGAFKQLSDLVKKD